ncbi:MAG: hypothetical protein IJX78_01935 [Bacilli bacterium]|nr:hypothetical protein [Bacilli bacterium]
MKIFYYYHLNKYPLIQKEDKIKLIYQGTLGPNHLGKGLLAENVKARVMKELLEECGKEENIYEWISEEFLRINLNKYYQTNNSLDYLVESFVVSSKIIPYNIETLGLELGKFLSNDELDGYDYKPISHSSIYRSNYLPHYLVVNKDYLKLKMRVEQLDNFIKNVRDYSVVSVEGKCTSGKTTISEALIDKYTIVHIDDFFLSKGKKTASRLSEIGGNIDYELVKDNLLKIKKAWSENQEKVAIKCFDCQRQTYYEKELCLKKKLILEGVYSYHPYFNEEIDYLAYIYVDDKTQMNRIEKRELKERFINEWIPLENKYFDYYKLEDICDIIV